MKVAVIQLQASDNKARNIEKAEAFVKEALKKGSQFILLPEVFVYRGLLQSSSERRAIAERIPGEATRPLMALARKHHVFILAGSAYERPSKEHKEGKCYNTSVLIDDRGQFRVRYRKIHLFDAVIGARKIKESDMFLAGKKTVDSDVKGFRVGLSICYDLRFPDLYQRYAQDGIEVLCVPAAFTYETGKAHWEILLRSRAIENLCYVLAPNQAGKPARGNALYGHSMIINPWGEVLAKASGQKEEIIYANLDKKVLQQKRRILPSLRRE